jgi:hypothetical protein
VRRLTSADRAALLVAAAFIVLGLLALGFDHVTIGPTARWRTRTDFGGSAAALFGYFLLLLGYFMAREPIGVAGRRKLEATLIAALLVFGYVVRYVSAAF